MQGGFVDRKKMGLRKFYLKYSPSGTKEVSGMNVLLQIYSPSGTSSGRNILCGYFGIRVDYCIFV